MAFFEITALDVALQDRFYNLHTGRWLVDRDARAPLWLFYHLPKVALYVFGGLMLIAALAPAGWRRRFELNRRKAFFILSCLVLMPILIGFCKKQTDIFCPWDLTRYGGDQSYRKFFENKSESASSRCGHCFPAGHPSGGFALMSLAFVFSTQRRNRIGLTAGFALGWMMGAYQILRGAHFLSHVVITMLLAWLVIQILAALFRMESPVKSAV